MYIISKHVNTVITLTYRLGPTKMTRLTMCQTIL